MWVAGTVRQFNNFFPDGFILMDIYIVQSYDRIQYNRTVNTDPAEMHSRCWCWRAFRKRWMYVGRNVHVRFSRAHSSSSICVAARPSNSTIFLKFFVAAAVAEYLAVWEDVKTTNPKWTNPPEAITYWLSFSFSSCSSRIHTYTRTYKYQQSCHILSREHRHSIHFMHRKVIFCGIKATKSIRFVRNAEQKGEEKKMKNDHIAFRVCNRVVNASMRRSDLPASMFSIVERRRRRTRRRKRSER